MRPYLPPILVASIVLIHGLDRAAARGQEEKAKTVIGSSKDRASDDPTLADLLAAHNKVRAEEKLPALQLEPRLTQAARAHARDMAEHSKLTHEGSDGSDTKTRIKRAGYHYREIGENVAGASAAVTTTDALHVYRLEVDTETGSIEVFFDGVSKLTGKTYTDPNNSPPYILFGEGSLFATGISDWDYVTHNAYVCGD